MAFPERKSDTEDELRIGLLLDSHIVPAWAAQLISDIQGSDCARIERVILQNEISRPRLSRPKLKNQLYQRYVEWDKRRAVLIDDPLTPTDISSFIDALPISEARMKLDVTIAIACDIPLELPTSLSTCWWVIYHGDPDCYAGVPPYFWELYDRNPVSGTAVLAVHPNQQQGSVLYKAFSATEQGWSLRQNASVPYWRASGAVLNCLRRLQQKREVTQTYGKAFPSGLPTNMQMVRFLARNLFRTISRRMRYSNQELYWFIAYRTDRSKFIANTESFHPEGFNVIKAPAGHFYADPFVLRCNHQTCIFVEDYSYEKQRGCISVLRMDKTGRVDAAEPVLERPYHLSYPFVFEHEGAVYMIPETLDANRIELYRATQMPDRWEFVAVLKEGVKAVDTTLWIENGLFYFFTNIAGRGVTVNDDLFLFYAESLLGEWRPHPHNPICADVRRSRGAGKLFKRNGKLVRPAQDCSVGYGYACQLNEIDLLSPNDYRERPLTRIEPNWYPGLVGTHTVNANETIEVIDGQINRPKPRASA